MEKSFDIRWSLVGFAGGGAFLLSFLLGALSGNPFLTILFRALLFGVIFAILGGGVPIVLDKFVPQLRGHEATAPPERKDGDGVDIVLEADTDEDTGAGEAGPLRDEESDLEELALERNPPADNGALKIGREEEAETLEATDTVEDDMEQAAVPEGEAEAELVLEEKDTDVPRRTDAPPPGGKKAPADEEGLDVLPDMSSFESSFSPVTSGGLVSDTESFDSFGSASLKTKVMDEDPATYVKAVRTVIKRDEGRKK